MISIKEIDTLIRSIKLSNEIFLSAVDLYNILNLKTRNLIQIEDCIIIPYYIHDGKRLELYQYEFNFESEDRYDFNKYVLNYAGKKSLTDIPANIIEIRKNCYFEYKKDDNLFNLKKLQKYLYFLFEYMPLQEEVQKIFGVYDKTELYVMLY